MRIYKNCDSLSIYHFYKIIDTGDLRYLIKGYDGEKKRKIRKRQQKRLEEAWESILNEYAGLTYNKEVQLNFRAQAKLIRLRLKYVVVSETLRLYDTYGDSVVLKLLCDVGMKFSPDEPIEPQVKRIRGQVKGLKMKVKIAEANYEKRFKKTREKIKINLEKQALILEVNLGIKSGIEVRNTSVTRWIMITQLNEEKTKEYGQV